MVHYILNPLLKKENVSFVRYDIHHALPSTANALIGRAAHIAVLDSELFIEKFLLVVGSKYFQWQLSRAFYRISQLEIWSTVQCYNNLYTHDLMIDFSYEFCYFSFFDFDVRVLIVMISFWLCPFVRYFQIEPLIWLLNPFSREQNLSTFYLEKYWTAHTHHLNLEVKPKSTNFQIYEIYEINVFYEIILNRVFLWYWFLMSFITFFYRKF